MNFSITIGIPVAGLWTTLGVCAISIGIPIVMKIHHIERKTSIFSHTCTQEFFRFLCKVYASNMLLYFFKIPKKYPCSQPI